MALEPITRQEKIIAGQDLTPITRMEKFLKEFGGGGSWDSLKDKPFGDFEVFNVPEMMLTTVANPDMGGIVGAFIEFASELTAPNEYTVKFGDAEYVCGFDGAGLGNLALAGFEDDTGEPFLIITDDGLNFVVTSEAVTNVPFSVRGVQAVPLEREYAPEAVLIDLVGAGIPTVNASGAVTCQFPDDKLFETASKKGTVKLRLPIHIEWAGNFLTPSSTSSGVNTVTYEDFVVSASIQKIGGIGSDYLISAIIYDNILFIEYNGVTKRLDAIVRRVALA